MGSRGVGESGGCPVIPPASNPPQPTRAEENTKRETQGTLSTTRQQPLPCPLRAPLGPGRGDECWGTPSVPLLTCLPFCTPSPVPGDWGTCLIPCGMRGTQQQGELQNDRKTGAAGSRAGSGLSQRGTLSCSILAQQSLPSAGARRRSPRSEPTLGPVSPTGVLAPPHRGTSPPLPRCPKPR